MINIRKFILLALGGLIVLTGIILGLNYLVSTHTVTITYSDANSVTITKRIDDKDQVIALINKSSDSVRLPNDTDYVIRYTGNTGFASGEVPLAKDTLRISITPDYSTAKAAGIMDQALPAAHDLILKSYPKADELYTLSSSGLRNRGKWYVVKLTFKGAYDYNSDNLKILLENKNGAWQLATKPDIIFTQVAYPSIPLDVLSWADTL